LACSWLMLYVCPNVPTGSGKNKSGVGRGVGSVTKSALLLGKTH
jgi:hypothetical protein